MHEKEWYESLLTSINENIAYYKNLVNLSCTVNQRTYYEKLLYNERIRFNYWNNCYMNRINRQKKLSKNKQVNRGTPSQQRVFTINELAQYDGSNGKPAYVAVKGIVYDVSLEATWGGGTHFSLYAGKDLTAQFEACHGGRDEVLRNLPQVGILEEFWR